MIDSISFIVLDYEVSKTTHDLSWPHNKVEYNDDHK